ncbi:MAG: glycerol acyltransferase [Bacteroidaceae bacterium]|nr:glycerol acyltransferase [Bacteroidaceae bacterium]
MATEAKISTIDIEAILRSRMGSKARYVPGFVFSWLKRFIHQDFINTYLQRGDEGVDFCRGALDYLGVTVSVEGAENLPADGRFYTFVSNHPLGAIDGLTLGAVIGGHYDGRVRYLVNDLLMNLQGLAPLCVPVNKLGSQGRNFSELVENAFTGEHHVIMFPAGICSRKTDGVIRDLPWQKAFVTRSVRHQRDVVPVHFIAHNSDRFYNVANWCKRLHLPNFAMALLPDEMYRSRGQHYRVVIGKPIAYQTFDKSKTPMEWAQYVKEQTYTL